MTAEMTVSSSPEKAHQYLLNYFEKIEDIELEDSEPDSIRVCTLGTKNTL